MKKVLCMIILCLMIWIVELKSGEIYKGKELSGGRYGITITMEDGNKVFFPWLSIKSVTSKQD